MIKTFFYSITLLVVMIAVQGCEPIDNRSVYLKSNEIVAHTIVAKMTADNLNTIAVIRFQPVDAESRGASDFLADRLVSDMTTAPNSSISVINRERMNEILTENQLKEAGILDRQTVIENGQMLGIDAIVIGRYKMVKNLWGTAKSLSITFECIDIERGVTFYANTLELSKGEFPEVVNYFY